MDTRPQTLPDKETVRVASRPRPVIIAPGVEKSFGVERGMRDAEALELLHIHSARGAFGVNGEGVTIAVLDTGARYSHQRFRRGNGDTSIIKKVNLTGDNFGVVDDAWDAAGHGTHVAGVIAAVAPAAKIVVIKVLPSGDEAHATFEPIIDGLAWVRKNFEKENISLVCLALGDAVVHSHTPSSTDPIYQVAGHHIAELTKNGVAVVASAGNDFTKEQVLGMCFPAILPDCISVGAVYDYTSRDPRSYHSSDGRTVKVTGTRMGQLMHDSARLPQRGRYGTTVFAPGAVIHSAGIHSDRAETRMEGTSQAAPFVVGVLALMQEYYRRGGHPRATVDALRNWLRVGARPVAGTSAAEGSYRLLDLHGCLTLMPTRGPRQRRHERAVGALRGRGVPDRKTPSDEADRMAEYVGRGQAETPSSWTPPAVPAYVPPASVYLAAHQGAQALAEQLSDLLTRRTNEPLSRGPHIPVFVESAPSDLPPEEVRIRFVADNSDGTSSISERFRRDASFARRVAVLVATQLRRLLQSGDSRGAPLTFHLAAARNRHRRLAAIATCLGELGCAARLITRLEPSDDQGVQVLLQYVGDSVSERLLAMQHILWAKERQLPIVSLHGGFGDARRALPYQGYVMQMHDSLDARVVVDELLRQALQVFHFRLRAPKLPHVAGLRLTPAVWTRPPELSDNMRKAGVLLYPDPPLSPLEHQLLRNHHPSVRTATPTLLHNQLLAEQHQPALLHTDVALSMSFSSEASSDMHRHHFVDLVVGLGRYLLNSGAVLHYGGLPPGTPIVDASGGKSLANLTGLLVDIASATSAPPDEPRIYNYYAEAFFPPAKDSASPQPSNNTHEDSLAIHVRTIAIATPADAFDSGREYEEGLQRAYERARGLDAMRVRVAQRTTVQILLGGKLAEFSGRYPGVAQEAHEALEAGNPIYVIGSFGGAAAAVGHALFGTKHTTGGGPGPRLGSEWEANVVPALAERYAEQRKCRGESPMTVEGMFERIAAYGEQLRSEPKKHWRNGLTGQENKQLFEARYVDEIVALVIRGLRHNAQCAAGEISPLPVRLYNGSIGDQAVQTEGYLLGCIAGVPLTGAALALPEPLRQGVEAAVHAETLNLAPGECQIVRVGDYSACFVVLPPLQQARQLPLHALRERVANSIQSGVHACLLAGVRSLTTVAVGITVLGEADSMGALIAGASRAWRQWGQRPDFTGLTICEPSTTRYGMIAAAIAKREQDGDVVVVATLLAATSPLGPRHPPAPLFLTSQLLDGKLSCLLLNDQAVATVPRAVKRLSPEVVAELFRRDATCRLGDLSELCDDVLSANIGEHSGPVVSQLVHASLGLNEDREGPLITLLDHLRRVYKCRSGSGPSEGRDVSPPLLYLCDNNTSGLPIEALCVDGELIALTSGVMRKLTVRPECHAKWEPSYNPNEPLRILAIGDPESNLPGARAEVNDLVKHCKEQRNGSIEVTSLVGHAASLDNICGLLERGRYDILHYAGHAMFDHDYPSGSGLMCSDGLVLTGAQLRRLTRLPCLAVINACQSAVLPTRELGAAPSAHAGIAEQLLLGGVNHYIGANWQVNDGIAQRFSCRLYEQLLAGKTLCHAVTAARREIRDSADWPAYVCYGHHDFRMRRTR